MTDFPERCACPESEWLRGLLASIVTADTEQGLADAVAAAAGALAQEQQGAEGPGEE